MHARVCFGYIGFFSTAAAAAVVVVVNVFMERSIVAMLCFWYYIFFCSFFLLLLYFQFYDSWISRSFPLRLFFFLPLQLLSAANEHDGVYGMSVCVCHCSRLFTTGIAYLGLCDCMKIFMSWITTRPSNQLTSGPGFEILFFFHLSFFQTTINKNTRQTTNSNEWKSSSSSSTVWFIHSIHSIVLITNKLRAFKQFNSIQFIHLIGWLVGWSIVKWVIH